MPLDLETAEYRELNTELLSERAAGLDSFLRYRVVGQDRARNAVVNMYESFHAGLAPVEQPIGSLLFLGPSGVGKTSIVESVAEYLFGRRTAMIKIDCAEFQHSHEIAKLIGSPPGYLGHRETPPVLTQEHINSYRNEREQFTVILFDEIEKASSSLWQLLLGTLDKATIKLGDNRQVDMSQTLIVITSNLGAREMSEMITGSIGFAPAKAASMKVADLEQKIYQTAIDSARRHFSPEFMNRIDKVVVFRNLTYDQLMKIVELELNLLQNRILAKSGKKFVVHYTDAAKQLLLNEGVDYRYGARHLKRAIRRFVEVPLSRLLSTSQIIDGGAVKVDEVEGKLVFYGAV